MNIVEVRENWPSDLLRVDITLGNICNYKCWYCWPGSNDGTHKWPDFDVFTENLSSLLDFYLNNTSKRRFDFHVMGGEATHWKQFIEFIKYFKDRYNCVFSITTNASKKLDWWTEAYKYLDYVDISVHHEYTDIQHVINVADFLYKKNVLVMAKVMMDPTAWNRCLQIIKKLTQSKYKWSIWQVEIIHARAVYSEEQKNVLKNLRVRKPNLFYFLRSNKSYKSRVQIIDDSNKVHRVEDHYIMLNRMNTFEGWECNVGVDWVAVKMDGTLAGICTNPLYNIATKFNLYDPNFVNSFNPAIAPAICQQRECWCMYEVNMPKRKVFKIKNET